MIQSFKAYYDDGDACSNTWEELRIENRKWASHKATHNNETDEKRRSSKLTKIPQSRRAGRKNNPERRRSSENKNKIFDLTLDHHHNCVLQRELLPPVVLRPLGRFSISSFRKTRDGGNYRERFQSFSTSSPLPRPPRATPTIPRTQSRTSSVFRWLFDFRPY